MYNFFYIQRFNSSQADLEMSPDACKTESCSDSKRCMNRTCSRCFQQPSAVLAATPS